MQQWIGNPLVFHVIVGAAIVAVFWILTYRAFLEHGIPAPVPRRIVQMQEDRDHSL